MNPDQEALDQARNVAELPVTMGHVCLMPDAHVGFGMPIGGVFGAIEHIVPNAVGMDIGCGMCAVKTSLKGLQRNELKTLLSEIRKHIPLGFKKHNVPQTLPSHLKTPQGAVCRKEAQNALFQMGTLGGGNHFIEIQEDECGSIWIMLHSGSRNLGKQVAVHYNKVAANYTREHFPNIPISWGLNMLSADSEQGKNYIEEMNYCMQFAKANRETMMTAIMNIFAKNHSCSFDDQINIHHNYAAEELHEGQKVWIHRKGATSAREGELGIIPGSQGTNSYIVKGKGNPLSYTSCSHGAGRILGRNQAKQKLDLKHEIEELNRKGVIHAIRTTSDLDEAPGAYKNIKTVMKEQEDLVDIVTVLRPLAVIKG